MYAKSLIFVALLAIGLLLPTVSQAQSARDMSSQASIDTANVPNGSIIVLSNEETSIPGYFHTRYAFVDENCGGPEIVDRYGPPLDPKDRILIQTEHRVCNDNSMNTRDGE